MNSRNHHMFSSFTKYLVEHPGGLAQRPNSVGFHDLVLTPAHTRGLSGATVESLLDHGEVNLTWERAGGLQCTKTPEGDTAALSCGKGGGAIKQVRFASFGKSCLTFVFARWWAFNFGSPLCSPTKTLTPITEFRSRPARRCVRLFWRRCRLPR